MKKLLSVLLFLLLCSIGACNKGYVPLSGKITFPDGKPLTKGTVVFSTSSFQARGAIKEDGTYVLGSLSESDGLPPGQYNVRIDGAVEPTGKVLPGPGSIQEMRPLIKSGFSMTCDVKKETKTFDIPVAYPE